MATTPDESDILQVAVDAPLHGIFDYLPPPRAPTAQPGSRVRVPFGRGERFGLVVSTSASSELPREKLKPVSAVIDDDPLLGPQDLRLLKWAAAYYHHPLGEVLASALPAALRQGAKARIKLPMRWRALPGHEGQLGRAPRQRALYLAMRQATGENIEEAAGQCAEGWVDEAWMARQGPGSRAVLKQLLAKGLVIAGRQESTTRDSGNLAHADPQAPRLNAAQEQAVASISGQLDGYTAWLLHGVTGSGKTEVYLRLAEKVLARGGQVLVLVPEIGLTPQSVARFRSRLRGAVVELHSAMPEQQRSNAFLLARGAQARVVVGTRSAIWTSLPELQLIIVDEEHDTSFKQQEGFRYSARDLALVRAKQVGIPVVLGSATPSLESLHNAGEGHYRLLQLPQRAGSARMPELRLVDIRRQRIEDGLCRQLLDAIGERLARGEQSLLFLNRRGFAPALICDDCGWSPQCPGCERPYTYHAQRRRLACHHCGQERRVPATCEACGEPALTPVGGGTQRLEEQLADHFPDALIRRVDRDSTRRKGALASLVAQATSGKAEILLGTQMLAKGHHFPGVTLVGIVDTDNGLLSSDFRAVERLAQLVEQVAGRCGRAQVPGQVLLQTRQPHHAVLQTLLHGGYPAVAELLLAERRESGWPPYAALVMVHCRARSLQDAMEVLRRAAAQITPLAGQAVQLLGPVPAPQAKRAGHYRAQLLLSAPTRAPLQNLLRHWLPRFRDQRLPPGARWAIDVDPQDLG